jgi:hypothetical protein
VQTVPLSISTGSLVLLGYLRPLLLQRPTKVRGSNPHQGASSHPDNTMVINHNNLIYGDVFNENIY